MLLHDPWFSSCSQIHLLICFPSPAPYRYLPTSLHTCFIISLTLALCSLYCVTCLPTWSSSLHWTSQSHVSKTSPDTSVVSWVVAKEPELRLSYKTGSHLHISLCVSTYTICSLVWGRNCSDSRLQDDEQHIVPWCKFRLYRKIPPSSFNLSVDDWSGG